MPKQPSKSGKRLKRDDDHDSDDSDEDLQPIHFFVPGENINAAVLVDYITRWVDRTAKITSAQHPTDKSRTGFSVLAKRALNAVSIRDLINDSRDWDLETQSREYRKDPYDYRESDTARRRAKKGPSEGGTNRPQQPRVKRDVTNEPADGGRQERVTATSNVAASSPQPAYHQPQPQYGQYSGYSQPHNMQPNPSPYYQGQSRPDQASPSLNITVNTATFAPRPGQPGQYMPTAYQTAGYAHTPQHESDPPPAYQQSMISRGPSNPQPPSHPGPDTFDAAKAGGTSRNFPAQATRQGSTDSKEDFPRSQSAQDRRPSTLDPSGRRSGR
ncbi:hypothetical protein AYO21_01664 [Fonsecaea monophora]|uniref:Uncharacterized protein n=2 Tax=Fonsecaea TaxID=40354 RepID=A0A0D2GWM2_9EURO|nr:uncharacterized protein Z517_00793 [Fonsecaea pedrosoi CBS 271.37]XP_022516159.1 hypothetical protein AYO21_01664 [Fonsecaea monophora]KAH0845075.1 hypothetical protein FOPE_09687 [Fonsecaea pedrosoi]KIW85403.1 hypothetical protein Z517_00793 [Fonsecaea pedrosoi CBS 271.37]OAG44207.1 hypothetical protein AYO21_01664 [Fonsecaea monophora]